MRIRFRSYVTFKLFTEFHLHPLPTHNQSSAIFESDLLGRSIFSPIVKYQWVQCPTSSNTIKQVQICANIVLHRIESPSQRKVES